MPADDSYRFPEGRKLKRLRGEQMVVEGISLTLDEILSEKSYTIFNEYWAVFRVTTARGNRYILKLRYQQDPDYFDSEDKFLCQRSANTSFHDELDCLRAMSSSTRTPNLIQSDEVVQGETEFYPGGYLRRIVMSIAPGQSIVDMWDLLTREDRELIRYQLAETLEFFRLRGWGFCDEETAQIHFDPVSREICLTGLSRAARQELGGDEITPTSPEVTAFGSFGL